LKLTTFSSNLFFFHAYVSPDFRESRCSARHFSVLYYHIISKKNIPIVLHDNSKSCVFVLYSKRNQIFIYFSFVRPLIKGVRFRFRTICCQFKSASTQIPMTISPVNQNDKFNSEYFLFPLSEIVNQL
jgi:hypothetical protein